MIPEKEADRLDPVAYGRSIAQGLGVNLLVRDVDRSARFQVAVLGAQIRYWEEHFAIMSAVGTTWLLHSDWSYRNHEMMSSVARLEARGAGIELRLYGADPDEAEAAAIRCGATVLAIATDKPHGLREVHIVDDDGYVWVPSRPTR
jgi:catechol 2,3-dioxygenase-like lactoylglutathione lyase family enzyme